jgi:hypothetical protein
MVDSVLVFRPDHRVTDANDNPVNNAKIKFREVGPGAPRTVYSDAALTVPLGTTVRTRADGYPVASAGSNTTILIYTGNTPFNIEITDEFDVPIFPAKDNVQGALDTSNFATLASLSTINIPVLSKTANYTVQSSDRGKLIAANASGGFFTVTLPSAITVGDGFNFGVRNDGTTNGVGISATQAIATSMGGLLAFTLRVGETLWFESNGATWKTSGYTPIVAHGTLGRFVIADRLSAPPGSPGAGARYILTAAPSGAWSTFAEHDIAEADGQGGWIRITPGTDGGWIAYVQDEDRFYSFKGSAWVDLLNPIRSVDMPAGSIVDRAYATYTANADLIVAIPYDDTIPQNTEGTEIITATITPKKTTNRIRATFTGQVAGTSSINRAIAALFKDSDADALQVTHCLVRRSATADGDILDAAFVLSMTFEHSPGTTSAVTYKIRAGSSTGNLRFNGSEAARFFGGASAATLVLEEIAT